MTPPPVAATCPSCARPLRPDPSAQPRDGYGHFTSCYDIGCAVTKCQEGFALWQKQRDCPTCNGLPTTVQPRLERDPPTTVRPGSPPVVVTQSDPAPRLAVTIMARRLYLSYRATRRADPLDAGAAGLPPTFDDLSPRQQPRFLAMAKTALRTIATTLDGLADEG